MSRITPDQIRDFINPLAFSKPRDVSEAEAGLTARQKRIETNTVNESLSLILGANKRLENMYGNLITMLELSYNGSRSSLSEREFNETFGKLRSLTAGFDEVVNATQFDEKEIFDGREIVLNSGAGKIKLQPLSISPSSEDGIDLIKRPEGSRAFISYDIGTSIRNQYAGITGIDIAKATGIPPEVGYTELEEDKYQIELIYQGPNSIIKLKDQFGGTVEKVENVNLAGSGNEYVDFKSGLRLDVEKFQLLESYDKWDWVNDGPVSLFADLKYEKVNFHELQDGEPARELNGEVNYVYRNARKYTGPALNFLDVEMNGIDASARPLNEGNYSIKVKYKGTDSILEVYDDLGRLHTRKSGIDLSAEGKHNIDTGLGFKFTLENKGWVDSGKIIQAQITYKPQDNETRTEFDFKSYSNKIEAALVKVEQQMAIFADAESQIRQIQSWQKGTSNNQGAISLLAAAPGSSLLGSLTSGGASTQSSIAAQQLFANIGGALSSQGNLPTNVLLQ